MKEEEKKEREKKDPFANVGGDADAISAGPASVHARNWD